MSQMMTKADLLAANEQSWAALKAGLNRLSEAQMTTVRDPAGWTVQDHLIHLAAWEKSVVYMLAGRPRHEGLGVTEALYLSGDYDAINEAIYRASQGRSLAEVRGELADGHQALLAALAPLDDSELQQAYSHFLPDEPGDGPGRPALIVVYSNSAHHFAEHLEWIEALAGGAAG